MQVFACKNLHTIDSKQGFTCKGLYTWVCMQEFPLIHLHSDICQPNFTRTLQPPAAPQLLKAITILPLSPWGCDRGNRLQRVSYSDMLHLMCKESSGCFPVPTLLALSAKLKLNKLITSERGNWPFCDTSGHCLVFSAQSSSTVLAGRWKLAGLGLQGGVTWRCGCPCAGCGLLWG